MKLFIRVINIVKIIHNVIIFRELNLIAIQVIDLNVFIFMCLLPIQDNLAKLGCSQAKITANVS